MYKVLGHEHAIGRFSTLMQTQRLPHAWMLHGVAGVGKSLLATQLAAIYLCESEQQGKACGVCHSCCMLAAESHPDFMQLAIAFDEKKKKFLRDISVGQVRGALSFLSLSGMESQRRVLVIDDADAMNGQAANALLKGLEEPVKGGLIVLVCHDITRLPATILSRCVLEHCAPLAQENMKNILSDMGLSGEVLTLAEAVAMGCPGKVQALQDEDTAQACLAWQRMIADIQIADIGAINDWLGKYVQSVPHDLIVAVLVSSLQSNLQTLGALHEEKQAVFDVLQSLLVWPAEVVRHSLRPAPALLSRILDMRRALKATV